MMEHDPVRAMEQVVRRVMKTVAKYDKIGKAEFEAISAKSSTRCRNARDRQGPGCCGDTEGHRRHAARVRTVG